MYFIFRYNFSAGLANTGRHFVAIMKTDTQEYVVFNDLNPRGIDLYHGIEKCDFAIYQLDI